MSQGLKLVRLLEMVRGGVRGNEAAPVWTLQAFNNSGGALARGDVVIWDTANSTADLIKCTTTTSANHPDVLGMVYDDTLANQAVGRIQWFGPTSFLKVNGTTDIAVGDYLSTYSAVKIAAKTTGAGAFARALEVYAGNDSNGVIAAFICNTSLLLGSLTAHTHATAGQGGQLDWDNVWADAVHSHGSDGEGGTLDWDNCWADAVHSHASNAEGGTLALAVVADVTATAAEVNAVADNQTITAGGTLTAKRFVGVNRQTALVDSQGVIGVNPSAITSGQAGVISCSGLQPVTADAPLAATDSVKVGVGGRATKHTTAQVTIQTAIAGEATAFTQPAGETALEIVQAADVEADRGRGIVVEGSNGAGVAITETIALHATNTTTAVAGATLFTKISAVYTADGNALGGQAVTVQASGGGAAVCTLGAAASELGADVPAQSVEAYCNEVTVTGPNGDTTFVTIVGVDSADAPVRERGTLDGASPSKFTTTAVFRTVERICLGELTNAGAGSVKTNATTDTAPMKCGVCVVAAAARGDDAIILVKPNA